MKANSDKSKQSNKTTRRVLAGVLCGASVLSLVLSLVMPPISQAIANDAQAAPTEETVMGGGSSSESTDVDNTTNGDTKNQNSDEVEGDETSGDAATAGLSSDGAEAEGAAQPADDGADDENAIAPAAENESTYEISSEAELSSKLLNENLRINGAATFKLTNNIDYNDEIRLDNANINITLNLNGHKIKHDSDGKPLFDIAKGATLTVVDDVDSGHIQETVRNGEQLQDKDEHLTAGNYGKTAKMSYDDNDIPTGLTYYVTESTASGAGTTEKICEHTATIQGAIVGVTKNSAMRLINVYEGGKFNLQGGTLTQKKDCNVGNLIYAENGSTVNMSGGYVCGASTTGSTGAGIMVSNEKGAASTLNLTGGVIAGNYAPNGGGVYAKGSMVNVDGSIISGNGTFGSQSGYGAGICAFESTVNVTSGYITNNKYQFYQDTDSTNWVHKGGGCHGGGGIAAFNGGSLKINGGYITGNYSAEAGGGIYAGAWKQALSTFTFSGGTIASNVAQNSEGGGIRIAAPTVGVFEVANGSHAYITNNTTNTTNDWGGGGVFVQGGNSDENVNSATLKIYNALITNNSAEGYGGGFAACPTGKTAITDTNGIAIFGNCDENGAHLSGGTNGKNEDQPTTVKGGEITDTFKQNGHKDLFLIRKSDNSDYIAAVTGQMLGGGAANWKGTIDGQPPTTIGKYEGAQAKYMIGLDADPSDGDQGLARDNATLFITGNKSNVHGGGIMTNGDVVAGSTMQVSVYPKMKLNGTKALMGRALKDGEFKFQLLKQGTNKQDPSFADHKLRLNGCTKVGNGVTNDGGGNFAFNLGEVYSDDSIVYYLVEDPGDNPVSGVTCDETIYKIDPKVVKDEKKSHKVLDIEYTYYTVSSVAITTIAANGTTSVATVYPIPEGDVANVALTSSKTFTNTYTPYDSKGSWTPAATKVVKGGEMKKFTLQLATDKEFTSIVNDKSTKADGSKSQTLDFDEIEYKLNQLEKLESDPTGRGASKTFTYYVREQRPTTPFTNYEYDQSVYQITVKAADNSKGKIDISATYKQIQDRNGNSVTDDTEHTFTDSTPTFTNTYSTSLPLSGMSGVTLTYLAGAAVLCAAAAWMHIRRKANAKGGERRE